MRQDFGLGSGSELGFDSVWGLCRLVAIEDGHISIIDGLARYRRAWFLAATGHIYMVWSNLSDVRCEVLVRFAVQAILGMGIFI